jgi:hypothetical protein
MIERRQFGKADRAWLALGTPVAAGDRRSSISTDQRA